MAEQDERQARMIRADMGREQADIVHQSCPAALAQIPVHIWISAGAMAAVILSVDHEAGVVERPGYVIVALGVLSHPVRQLDRGPRLVFRVPPVGNDLRAVRRLIAEFAGWHPGCPLVPEAACWRGDDNPRVDNLG